MVAPGDRAATLRTSPTALPTMDEFLVSRLTPDELTLLLSKIQAALAGTPTSNVPLPTTHDPTALARQHSETNAEHVPAQIFSTELAPAEAVVKYLKEELGWNYHRIGVRLKRDERGIWGTYRRATRKMPTRFVITDPRYLIPLDVLCTRETSVLESVIGYLVDSLHLTFSEAATLLVKSYSTVYTTYTRASRKSGNTTPYNEEQRVKAPLKPQGGAQAPFGNPTGRKTTGGKR
ncbi:hypothetical protein HY641_02905 [Candidatus Woesearchaeota archaeon]|nr:hypothetical protein [Candidatus Woesearchaeota archaeon]